MYLFLLFLFHPTAKVKTRFSSSKTERGPGYSEVKAANFVFISISLVCLTKVKKGQKKKSEDHETIDQSTYVNYILFLIYLLWLMAGYYTGDLSLPLLKYFWIEIRTRFKSNPLRKSVSRSFDFICTRLPGFGDLKK